MFVYIFEVQKYGFLVELIELNLIGIEWGEGVMN